MDEAFQITNVPKAIESIKLQRDFHLKHIELIRLKKQQYEKYKLAVEQQRIKNADIHEQRTVKNRIETTCDLQIAIYKTLEESDSLIETLNSNRSSGKKLSADGDNSSLNESKTTVCIENVGEVKMGIKKLKSENCVVDELHTLNHQLHILVYNLVSRMDESNYEMEKLSERVKLLEKEKNIKSTQSSTEVKDTNGPANPNERGKGRRSSFTGEERKIILPDSSDLPPLELPEFDYSNFDEKK